MKALFVFKNGVKEWLDVDNLLSYQYIYVKNNNDDDEECAFIEKTFKLQLKRKSLSPPVNTYYYIEQ